VNRLIIAVLVFAACAARAQTAGGWLTVTADPPGAYVYLDSTVIGTAPVTGYPVSPGAHRLRCTDLPPDSWSPGPAAAESVFIRPGDTLRCTLVVERVYHVVTEPGGARVMEGDSVIAVTPCFLGDRVRGKALVVRSPGCEDELLVLPGRSGSVFLPLHSCQVPPVSPLVTESQQRNLTPVYLSAGSAILSGAVAAYFKTRADSYYSDYRSTGDAALLEKIHRYDTIAGVALVASQVSLGFLAYLLLSK
jgi:hypothetical protein